MASIIHAIIMDIKSPLVTWIGTFKSQIRPIVSFLDKFSCSI